MDSYLLIGMIFFIYASLVQTSNRDDLLKEIIDGVENKNDVALSAAAATQKQLLQKDFNAPQAPELSKHVLLEKKDDNTRIQNRGTNTIELKREIIDAFVNLLYDKLQKKTRDEMLRKELLSKLEAEEEEKKKELMQITETKNDDIPALKKLKKDPKKSGVPDEKKRWNHDLLLRGPPGLWGKKEAEEAKQYHHDTFERAYVGPPGLWGREAEDASKEAGPPGLWGRELENAADLVSKDYGDQKGLLRGPPGLWGRELKFEKRQNDELQKSEN